MFSVPSPGGGGIHREEWETESMVVTFFQPGGNSSEWEMPRIINKYLFFLFPLLLCEEGLPLKPIYLLIFFKSFLIILPSISLSLFTTLCLTLKLLSSWVVSLANDPFILMAVYQALLFGWLFFFHLPGPNVTDLFHLPALNLSCSVSAVLPCPSWSLFLLYIFLYFKLLLFSLHVCFHSCYHPSVYFPPAYLSFFTGQRQPPSCLVILLQRIMFFCLLAHGAGR